VLPLQPGEGRNKEGELGMIESYSFGKMKVDGEVYTSDLILLPGQVLPNWWRKEGHRLSLSDLKEVLSASPSVLVVGTGAYGYMAVPEELKKALSQKGIRLIVQKTDAAARAHNELCKKEKVAGAFHLTC